MGDMSEMYDEDYAEQYDEDVKYILDLRDRGYWRVSNGTEIKITDMDDGHLINTINLLKRNGDSYGYINKMTLEAKRRNLI